MNVKFSQDLKRKFADFLGNHQLLPFRTVLCSILLEHIRENDGLSRVDFPAFLWTMEDFFELLDQAAAEIQKQEISRLLVQKTKETVQKTDG